ncbi:DUF4394 domain-containing protein [Hymenobacter guriensis]|uniref:DUF4394 domain-containing protein n=1 Tax=Hymenobacter guriensis TaxID=2793065 RepID=A0ABS0L115_9BACT|nr:DUF4394 domain-containing protein [Hymenobacter guriensis]MBG8553810.1 DUF4394 domain-containing protein [Hymenobacter guriensis]
MPTPLLPPRLRLPGNNPSLRRWTLGLGLLLTSAGAASAQTIYGLSGTNNNKLVSFAAASPGTLTSTNISGLANGQMLVGLDFRPATGELYALGYNAAAASPATNAQLYVINRSTGAATAVGSASRLELGGSSERIGFDFNPTVDRIRIVSSNDFNYRLHPTTGAIVDGNAVLDGVQPDGTLAYAPADANAGQNPGVGTAAYTNSFIGSTSTTLYVIDELAGRLLTQNPPNAGTLNTAGTLPGFSGASAVDADIYFDPATRTNDAFLLATADPGAGPERSTLYRLNLDNGTLGTPALIGGPSDQLSDIAVLINRTAPAPSGQLLYAVSSTNNLLSFYSGTPGFINSATPITGIAAGQTLAGTDFRPNTGQLFGLGYNPTNGESRLYVIDRSTAVATPVGSGPITLNLGTTTAAVNGIGFDFNPTVDRLRVTSLNQSNYRLNPNNGAIVDGNAAEAGVQPDGDLKFVDGTTGTPTIGAVAYTNSYVGATSTTLYDIDGVRNRLFVQTNPNAGELTAVNGNALFADAGSSNIDLDVYFDPSALVNRAFAVSDAGSGSPAGFSTLYSVNLLGASTSSLGVIGGGIPVRDVAAFLTGANASAPLSGRLLYGVAGGNLVSFGSGNPEVIRTAVNITGLGTGQVVAGVDFRPATGALYALGYDAPNQQAQLYTLNTTTGALTAVGGVNNLALGTSAAGIGFDFNPVPDRIRVVGAGGVNYRLNPTVGTDVVTTDGTTGRSLSAAAYTNNDNNTATGTALYAYEQSTNQVIVFSDPNAGTNSVRGASGITVNPGVDFDIFADVADPATPDNTAYLVATPTGSTSDNLYTVALGSGAASLVGRIGSGSNLTGLAAFLEPAPVLTGDLTWTGAVDTDWGTAGNWLPMQVPTATSNVIIPNVANDPVVDDAQQANNLTLGSGATLFTANGGVLTVNGAFTNNGGLTDGTGTGEVRFMGAAAQTISGSTTMFNNLTVGSAGVLAGGPVQVQRVLLLNGNLTSNGNLTLLSNAEGTAHVVNTSGAVLGTATVQRYILSSNNGLGYRHYSSPVVSTTVADLATTGFTPVVNPAYNTSETPGSVKAYPTVFGYDEQRLDTSPATALAPFTKGWFSPASLASSLERGRGYTVNLPGTALVDFEGTLNNGPIAQTGLTRTTTDAASSGWHLLGNPYPSPIDWSALYQSGASGLNGAVYIFASSGQYSGNYSSFVNGVPFNGQNIAAAQGFFVRVTTPGTTGSLTFSNAARLTTYASPAFQRGTGEQRPLVQLDLLGQNQADATYAYWEQGATPGFDARFDAVKFPVRSGLSLALLAGTEEMSISGLPALNAATTTELPLTVRVPAAGTYTLHAAQLLNLPAGMKAYLRDAQTGQLTDLNAQPRYAFSTTADGLQAPRFTLVLSASSVLAAAPAALREQVALYPNPARDAVRVLLPASLSKQPVEAVLVNSLGQTVRRQAVAADQRSLSLRDLAPGVYTVQLRTAQGLIAKRLVVQ